MFARISKLAILAKNLKFQAIYDNMLKHYLVGLPMGLKPCEL